MDTAIAGLVGIVGIVSTYLIARSARRDARAEAEANRLHNVELLRRTERRDIYAKLLLDLSENETVLMQLRRVPRNTPDELAKIRELSTKAIQDLTQAATNVSIVCEEKVWKWTKSAIENAGKMLRENAVEGGQHVAFDSQIRAELTMAIREELGYADD